MTEREQHRRGFTRRAAISTIAAGAVFAPTVLRAADRQVVLRTSGGAYEDAMRAAIYDPFTKATGIKVVPVAATAAKMLAMVKANDSQLDVLDASAEVLALLQREGGLVPIDYA